MTSSRLIRADSPEAAAVSWRAPDVAQVRSVVPPAKELDELRAQARAQGFSEGRAAGLEAGARELAERCAAVERALDLLARPLDESGHRVEEELLGLVQAVVRQLYRREVHLDSTHIVGLVREGLAALPLSTDPVSVRLHPADAEVLRSCLGPAAGAEGARAWHVETDPLMERGGCVIATARSVVDARLDARLARVMAALAGDERGDHG